MNLGIELLSTVPDGHQFLLFQTSDHFLVGAANHKDVEPLEQEVFLMQIGDWLVITGQFKILPIRLF